jgi:hypothetical protein
MFRRDRQAARVAAFSALLAAAAVGGRARAEVVDATSTTLLSGHADPRDGVVHTSVPLFELVSVRATDLRVPHVDDMIVILSGWGEIAFADTDGGHRGLGDLDIAFVEGKMLRRRVTGRRPQPGLRRSCDHAAPRALGRRHGAGRRAGDAALRGRSRRRAGGRARVRQAGLRRRGGRVVLAGTGQRRDRAP